MDAKVLDEYEANITAMRQYMLEDKPVKGKFGINHLKNIHKYIFQDIYPFAGKLRLEDIWKGETYFCKTQFIESTLDSLLTHFKEENYLKGLDAEEFAKRISFYMSELNIIHPFREGNGRTIREFIRCLALEAGFELDWSLVDSQELLDAAIIAVNDNLEPLESCLYQAIVKD